MIQFISVIAALLAGSDVFGQDPPLSLQRDGFMYVGGKTMTVDGKEFLYGQMYVEIKIPARQTHPYPIVMVHGGTGQRPGASDPRHLDMRQCG